jgi:integrase
MKSSSKGREFSGLYQRGKQFWFRYRHNGHQYRVPLGTDDPKEALAQALAIRADPVLSGASTFKREVDAYVRHQRETKGFSRNSAENRRAVLLAAAEALEKTEPARVTAHDVQRWYESLKNRKERSLTESTAQSYVMMLRGFFRYLIEQKKLRENPAAKVKFARIRANARAPFCDKETVDRLLENCARPDLKFVLFCGFHAGLRKEEIVQARPEWFDGEAGLIHLQRSETWEPKDKEDRTVPLTQAFKTFLEKEFQTPGPFMVAPEVVQGKSRYRWDFRRPFDEYVAAQKVPWVTPHVMRHTFASLLASRGVSIYKVAKWLGDGVDVVQRHYAHLLPKDDDIERAFA